MILSIIIPTSKFRKRHFDHLLATLLPQINGLDDQIEILADTGKDPIGMKLKEMLKDAQGKYVWVLKDSFLLSDSAVKDIFSHASDCEVMEIKGMTLVNGKNPYDWQEVSRHSPMLTGFARTIKYCKDDQKQKEEILRHKPIIKLIENPLIQKRIELKRHTQASH